MDTVRRHSLRIQGWEAAGSLPWEPVADKASPGRLLKAVENQIQGRVARGCEVPAQLAPRAPDGQAAAGVDRCVQTRILRRPQEDNRRGAGEEAQSREVDLLGARQEGRKKAADGAAERALTVGRVTHAVRPEEEVTEVFPRW